MNSIASPWLRDDWQLTTSPHLPFKTWIDFDETQCGTTFEVEEVPGLYCCGCDA